MLAKREVDLFSSVVHVALLFILILRRFMLQRVEMTESKSSMMTSRFIVCLAAVGLEMAILTLLVVLHLTLVVMFM